MKVWQETVLCGRNKVQWFCMFEGHEEDRSLEHNKWLCNGGGAYHELDSPVMGWDSYSEGKGKLLGGLSESGMY